MKSLVFPCVAPYHVNASLALRTCRISHEDVELVLRIGEGQFDEEDGTLTYEVDRLAVVIVERRDTAHVVTVMRKRKHQ